MGGLYAAGRIFFFLVLDVQGPRDADSGAGGRSMLSQTEEGKESEATEE